MYVYNEVNKQTRHLSFAHAEMHPPPLICMYICIFMNVCMYAFRIYCESAPLDVQSLASSRQGTLESQFMYICINMYECVYI